MCSVAIAGPASLEAWRWLVSSTDMIATPHELAICWVMFSSVEPRATSWARRVFSAEVNSGIIVAPMPRPITNSSAMITGYGVVAVSWVSPNMPIRMTTRPNGTIRPIGRLSTRSPRSAS